MEKAYVLDTTAFIARWPLYAPGSGRLYTTSLVVEEVRDSWSREGLELALGLGRVEVRDPRPAALRRVLREAARAGLHSSLSRTDTSVAALALELAEEGLPVVVVTDDYAVQNLAAILGLEYMPLRTRGIERVEDYIVACPACGYVSRRPGERVCPVCGTPLRRVRRRGRRR
ncbi:DNA-binding protein [Pyrodictium occultum]|uniref:DNA-binding protein n=1 Tax=Pyrodictium occultum TaxID=2309 RepID=A0A0V8RTX2_PYROC|nr:NOB1 family endonuclease [Pyrodictium occultum]KSW11513.1 DNA-binding protein [Pyrodictium occultum]